MSKTHNSILDRSISFVTCSYNGLETKLDSLSNTKRKRCFCWAFTVTVCFSILLLLNILTPMIADDFCYLFIYDQYDTKVASLSDIILSQKNHYYLWGGRSVVHFIAQTLLLLPPLVIDILNTCMYLVYVGLIYLIIRGRKQNSLILFILINLAIWFFQPAYGDTILWITGSANYLWGTVLILLFILPYRFYKGLSDGSLITILKTIPIFIFGIIAGWTNENTATAMLVIAILFLLYFRSNSWRIPMWSIFGILGAVVGYLIMILAPGNQERAGDAATFDLLVIGYRIFMHTYNFISYCGGLNLFGLIALVLFWHFGKEGKKDTFKLLTIFFIGALVAVYSMILSPAFPPRAWFGVVTFNITAIGLLLFNLNYDYKFLRQIRLGVVLVGLLAFLFSFYLALKDVYSLDIVMQQREELVKQAKKQNLPYCVFEQFAPKTKFIHPEDVNSHMFMYGYYDLDIQFRE